MSDKKVYKITFFLILVYSVKECEGVIMCDQDQEITQSSNRKVSFSSIDSNSQPEKNISENNTSEDPCFQSHLHQDSQKYFSSSQYTEQDSQNPFDFSSSQCAETQMLGVDECGIWRSSNWDQYKRNDTVPVAILSSFVSDQLKSAFKEIIFNVDNLVNQIFENVYKDIADHPLKHRYSTQVKQLERLQLRLAQLRNQLIKINKDSNKILRIDN